MDTSAEESVTLECWVSLSIFAGWSGNVGYWSFLDVCSGGSAIVVSWTLLVACARGSFTLCASVVVVSDVGATFLEVDIQGSLMTEVFHYLPVACVPPRYANRFVPLPTSPNKTGLAYTPHTTSISKRQICKIEVPCRYFTWLWRL